MLTDYHVHLRPDDVTARAGAWFTEENVARYRTAASERGIAELGVSEHVYRFRQALAVWLHPLWRRFAIDDIDAYCEFVRNRTDLRLGIEADFVPGGEDRMADLLTARDFDYVIGSVHFLRDESIDMDDYSVWGSSPSSSSSSASSSSPSPSPSPSSHSSSSSSSSSPASPSGSARPAGPVRFSRLHTPEEIWTRYFQTLAQAARSGLFDILAHPDLVKVWGPHRPDRPMPEGDLRRYYEPAVEAIAESNVAIEVSTAGLRKPVGEIYPARALLDMCVEAGAPIALSSDAHRPDDVGADYDRALELLSDAGVTELCVFERRTRRLEPIGEVVA